MYKYRNSGRINERRSRQLDRAVSIYTAQWLELDYVGLVWGEDLVRRTGKWVAQTRFAEPSLRQLDPIVALSLLKNRYRVLLTRAMKGIAIFCTASETAAYTGSQLPV